MKSNCCLLIFLFACCFLLQQVIGKGGRGGGRGGSRSRSRGSSGSSKSGSSVGYGGSHSTGTRRYSHTFVYMPSGHSQYSRSSINHNVEICDDFYTHACGSWSFEKAISPLSESTYADSPLNQFTVLQSKVDFNLRSMLSANQTEKSLDVQLFEKCFHQGFTDDFSKLLSSFLPAGDNLDYKSWPILERLPKKDDNEVHGDWWYKIYAHLTLLDVQPLFLFQIDPNSGLIHLRVPKYLRNFPVSRETSADYWGVTNYLAEEVAYFFQSQTDERTDHFWPQVSQIIFESVQELERKLARAARLNTTQSSKLPDWTFPFVPLKDQQNQEPLVMSLGELVSSAGSKSLDWYRLLGHIRKATFTAGQLNETNQSFSLSTLISVDNFSYFKQLSQIIDEMTDEKAVVNYLLWKAFHSYYYLVDGPLRVLFEEYLNITSTGQPLVKRCTDLVATSVYPWTTARRYLKTYVSKTAQSEALAMVDDIRKEFSRLLGGSEEWLPAKEVVETGKRLLKEMKVIIGGPQLQEKNFAVKVGEATFAGDLDQLFARIVTTTFDKILLGRKTEKIYRQSVLNFKVLYDQDSNNLVIPFSLLQTPFFNESSSARVPNMAALGSLIATELVLGFRDFWWNETYFSKGSVGNCFKTVNIFDSTIFPKLYKIAPFSSHVEAIAADRALRIADSLFRSQFWFWPSDEAKDSFYITYAQAHCAEGALGQLVKSRVNNLLQFEPPFAEFYECASEASMSNQKFCLLWTDGKPFKWSGAATGFFLLIVIILFIVCVLKSAFVKN